jgi:hypothetical protein
MTKGRVGSDASAKPSRCFEYVLSVPLLGAGAGAGACRVGTRSTHLTQRRTELRGGRRLLRLCARLPSRRFTRRHLCIHPHPPPRRVSEHSLPSS